jgi:hypothetical protein
MKSNDSELRSERLRSFGFILGIPFAALGLWPALVHGSGGRLWAVVLGGGLIGTALVAPQTLKPAYTFWMYLGKILGWINSRIILGLCFYGLFTPLGMVMRMAGRDSMRRRFKRDLGTYRETPTPRRLSHMRDPF